MKRRIVVNLYIEATNKKRRVTEEYKKNCDTGYRNEIDEMSVNVRSK